MVITILVHALLRRIMKGGGRGNALGAKISIWMDRSGNISTSASVRYF
jgi:hypothetical protein